MNYVTVLGLMAAFITTVSLFPQLVKIWRTKSAKDISLVTFSLFCVGIFLWFVYGVVISDVPLIGANFFSFIQGLVILLLKIKYK
jgi:MtN3 and saliva related transmembrane protein